MYTKTASISLLNGLKYLFSTLPLLSIHIYFPNINLYLIYLTFYLFSMYHFTKIVTTDEWANVWMHS